MTFVSVTIPIGPLGSHQRYLSECLDSIMSQTVKPHTVLIVDDMARVDKLKIPFGLNCKIWEAPWRLGVASSFNAGVNLAPTECIVMLGADDTLDKECIEQCEHAYRLSEYPETTYFALGVKYMDSNEEQYLACGAAMVTKNLWRLTGGFPPEAAVGASDTMLLSQILAHNMARIDIVNKHKTLYNYRRHEESDTALRHAWQNVIWDTRGILTESWKRPEWGRYANSDVANI